MLVLAKNIVLERNFLTQIHCQVPEPPFIGTVDSHSSVAEDSTRNRLPASSATTLEEALEKWDMTDMYSPYLITNYVRNRSTLIYKKIKIVLKQREEPIPSGPTAYDR